MTLGHFLMAMVVASGCVLGVGAQSGLLGENTARACGTEKNYTSRGVIREFGPEKSSVAIAHEGIAGYLPAALGVFDARERKQLEGLTVGDKVTFSFAPAAEGRQVLTRIVRDSVAATAANEF